MRYKSFAIDFDDTITIGTKFPEIGKLRPHADRVIRRIKENNGEIAIWTCRTGEHIDTVKDFLEKYNIPYDSFNDILPSERMIWGEGGRKIYADCYIDDHSIYAQINDGIDWLQIEQYLFGNIDMPMSELIKARQIDASVIRSFCIRCGKKQCECFMDGIDPIR